MMDGAVDQWIKRLGLPPCEKMKGHRLEHLLNKNIFILGATLHNRLFSDPPTAVVKVTKVVM